MAKDFKGSDSKKRIQQKQQARSYSMYGRNGRNKTLSYSATHPVTCYLNKDKKVQSVINNDKE